MAVRVKALVVIALHACLSLLAASTLHAGEADYIFRMLDHDVSVDGTVEVPVVFENNGGDVQGFAFGVCHDSDYLTIESAEFNDVLDDLGSVFTATSLFDGAGYSAAKAFGLGMVLEAPFEDEILIATYTADGESADVDETTGLEFCEDLGDGLIIEVVVDLESFLPELEDATITIIEDTDDIPPATFSLCNLTVTFFEGEDLPPVCVTVFIENNPDHPDAPVESDGFQFGLEHDGGFLDPVGITALGELADLNDGSGPLFLAMNAEPKLPKGVEDAITVGCVYSIASDTLTFEDRTEVLEIEYEFVGKPDELDGPTPLSFRDDIGIPIITALVVDGSPASVPVENGSVNMVSAGDVEDGAFRRGDVDGDGIVSPLSDAFFLLRFGFNDGAEPPCQIAADVNGNEEVGALPDAMALFAWGFAEGKPPSDPGPFECGTDTESLLDCQSVPPCIVPDVCE